MYFLTALSLFSLSLLARGEWQQESQIRFLLEGSANKALPVFALPAAEGREGVSASQDLGARFITEGIREFSRMGNFSGLDYFRTLSPGISPQIRFTQTAPAILSPAFKDYWTPEGAAQLMKSQDKANEISELLLPLDKNLFQRILRELDALYPENTWPSQEAKIKRAVLFLIPRAAAELEAARVMHDLQFPNYVYADALEGLRLAREYQALQLLLEQRKEEMRKEGFLITPSEYEYLKSRFEPMIKSPGSAVFENMAKAQLENLKDDPAFNSWPLLMISRNFSSEDSQKRVDRSLNALRQKMKTAALDERQRLQYAALEAAQIFLANPDNYKRMRDMIRLENSSIESMKVKPSYQAQESFKSKMWLANKMSQFSALQAYLSNQPGKTARETEKNAVQELLVLSKSAGSPLDEARIKALSDSRKAAGFLQAASIMDSGPNYANCKTKLDEARRMAEGADMEPEARIAQKNLIPLYLESAKDWMERSSSKSGLFLGEANSLSKRLDLEGFYAQTFVEEYTKLAVRYRDSVHIMSGDTESYITRVLEKCDRFNIPFPAGALIAGKGLIQGHLDEALDKLNLAKNSMHPANPDERRRFLIYAQRYIDKAAQWTEKLPLTAQDKIEYLKNVKELRSRHSGASIPAELKK